ncbi:MAG TPA: DUF222 domain-containing protein [Amycolatopsis sp.]|jgi:hypothetical protein|nr:DUF222 domain-containing protein [Amycolatopsis sp.]
MDKHDEPDWTAATLLETDVTGLDETRTLSYLRAISQVEARLEAARLQAIEHFSALNGHSDAAPGKLARELKITRSNAARDTRLAHELTYRLPRTLTALETGDLDPARAAQVARATRALSDTQARSVDDRLYPAAVDKNPKPLGEFLRSAVAQEAPGVPRERSEHTALERTEAPSGQKSGPEQLIALMRELDLVEVDLSISGAAQERKYFGDTRSLRELRLAVLRERLLNEAPAAQPGTSEIWELAQRMTTFSDRVSQSYGYTLDTGRAREPGLTVMDFADVRAFRYRTTHSVRIPMYPVETAQARRRRWRVLPASWRLKKNRDTDQDGYQEG